MKGKNYIIKPRKLKTNYKAPIKSKKANKSITFYLQKIAIVGFTKSKCEFIVNKIISYNSITLL